MACNQYYRYEAAEKMSLRREMLSEATHQKYIFAYKETHRNFSEMSCTETLHSWTNIADNRSNLWKCNFDFLLFIASEEKWKKSMKISGMLLFYHFFAIAI